MLSPPVPAALLVNLLTCHPISCLCRCAGLLLLRVIKVHNLTIYSFPAVSGARVPGHQSPHSHTEMVTSALGRRGIRGLFSLYCPQMYEVSQHMLSNFPLEYRLYGVIQDVVFTHQPHFSCSFLSLICLSTNQNIQLIHSLLIRIEWTTGNGILMSSSHWPIYNKLYPDSGPILSLN